MGLLVGHALFLTTSANKASFYLPLKFGYPGLDGARLLLREAGLNTLRSDQPSLNLPLQLG